MRGGVRGRCSELCVWPWPWRGRWAGAQGRGSGTEGSGAPGLEPKADGRRQSVRGQGCGPAPPLTHCRASPRVQGGGKSAQDPRGQNTDLPGASPGLWGKGCREGQRIKEDLKVK